MSAGLESTHGSSLGKGDGLHQQGKEPSLASNFWDYSELSEMS